MIMKVGVLLRKAVMKVSAYVLLIGLLVCGPALGFAFAQSVQDEYVLAEGYDDCAEDADCPCSGLYCASACDSGCKGDCAPDLGDVYDGCADACCINDTDCKHECPNHADCDCPEDGDGDPTGSEDDNNGKYPIDTTVPWYQDAERTESGNLILTYIYTGELDDLWVWRSDDEGENWTPYWNTLGSGTANGQITVTSERPEGDYLYVTIPDAAAEFPAATLLVFETQHPEIVCVMYINLELEFGWVDTLGKGGDRTGVDKFPRPQRDGEGDEGGDGNNTPPDNGANTGEEKPSDGTNGTETISRNQGFVADVLNMGGRSEGSTKSGRSSTPAMVVETRSEPSAPDSSAAPGAVASDIEADATPETAPPAKDTAPPSAGSNRAFTATAIIGIAAALLAGAGVWVKRRRLRSR
ncbi:hypothetical protein AGMMS49983_19950 [Clostridia bacterium]|nr:hypothetical protein AGMMS49983_19950 [Clostridia bacterium]